MRSEGSPLDLNNLPEDYAKQTSEDSSSSAVAGGGSGYRKKKNGGKVDECGKVYECRFCSLKFCKSQALGGHMNRHRQERETETLNKARQLVFSNDLAPTTHHLGYVSSNGPHGGYHHHQATGMSESSLHPFRSMYHPTRLFPASSPPMYTPPPPPRLLPFPSGAAPMNDYYVGHVLSSQNEGNYTCIGAPVGHGGGVRDMTLQNQEEGLNWGRR